eukprot:1157773-Pelagomonas_calceolata.AAC.5
MDANAILWMHVPDIRDPLRCADKVDAYAQCAMGKTHRKHGWLYMHPLYLMRTPHSGAHGAASLLSLRATDVIVGA